MYFSKKIFTFLCFAFASISICHCAAQGTLPALIPMPQVVKMDTGLFMLPPNFIIRTNGSEQPAVDYFSHQLRAQKINASVVTNGRKPALFITSTGAEHLPAEGYRLQVTPAGITLTGKQAGIFYGMQTLLQLMTVNVNGNTVIPCLTIEDAPRFGYRGLMLDVSRHFFTVEQLKQLLDLMAYYKLNRFHWHLTDDQGWRLEIKSYPELTRVGAWRVPRLEFSGNTLPPQPGEKATDGGYYTQEQVRDIIRYAADRHIDILPEIDVPGHSMAAIAAYPELCVTRDKSITVNPGSPFAKWFTDGSYEMYTDNSLNPTNEKVYEFLDNVFSEVAALFPYPYIHIGGDECFKGFWQKDSTVQQFMRQHQVKDAHELQRYFISRLNKIILSKNKKLIGWDEITEGNLEDQVAVMNRFGEKGALAQTKKGMDIVLAPGGNGLYFDYAQSTSDQEPSSHGGDAPTWKAYEYNPAYASLSPADLEHIMGVEGCIWTENIKDMSKLQYMLLPRMLALAETGWTNNGQKNYPRFANSTLPAHLARFDRTSMNYRVPTVFNYVDSTIVTDSFRLEIKQPPVPGAKIFYTLNNRPPGDYDHEYTGPVTIIVPKGKSIPLKTIVITPAGRRSIITRTLLDNSDKPKIQ